MSSVAQLEKIQSFSLATDNSSQQDREMLEGFVEKHLYYACQQMEPNQNYVFTTIKTIVVNNSIGPNWNNARKDILSSLSWTDLQIGSTPEIEQIITLLIAHSSYDTTIKWVYDLTLSNAHNSLLLCSILHVLSHFDYEEIYPYGPMLAMAFMCHDDIRVVSYAMKAFSNWNAKDSLKYIDSISFCQEWARDEWNSIKEYIKENGDDLNVIFNENDCTAKMDTETRGHHINGRY